VSAIATVEKSPEERKAILADVIAGGVKRGWRVESQTDYQVVLVHGHRPNQILHLLLSIITLGLWIPVWILVAVFGGEKRRVITVGDQGQVTD